VTHQAPSAPAPARPGCQTSLGNLPSVCSRELLRGGNLILIEHGHERYFLRMTRNNKLILTK
jgi:hemin uptake protein HemP